MIASCSRHGQRDRAAHGPKREPPPLPPAHATWPQCLAPALGALYNFLSELARPRTNCIASYEGELFRVEDIRVVAPAERVAPPPHLATIVRARPAR